MVESTIYLPRACLDDRVSTRLMDWLIVMVPDCIFFVHNLSPDSSLRLLEPYIPRCIWTHLFENWFLLSCSTLLREISLVKVRSYIGVWRFAIHTPSPNDHLCLSHPFLGLVSFSNCLLSSSRARRLVPFIPWDRNRGCYPYLDSS